jgi:TolA-binding protein
VADFLREFGNWLLAIFGTAFAYVAWRERTVSKVATLGEELVRVEKKIAELEGHLEQRRGQDISIITALAEIKAQLTGLTNTVSEIKIELRHKQDKQT